MKARGISPSRVARVATLLSFSFFVSWLAQKGKLSAIVHPRMNPWIELSGVICLALAFFQLLRLDRRPRRSDPSTFFVPITFVMAMTFVFVRSGTLAAGRFSAGDDSLAAANATILRRDNAASSASKGPLPKTIVFDDDRYWTLYNRLYDSPPEARGHKIVVQGFIDRPAGSPGNVAIVGRNMMWCCSADMAVIGFLARGAEVGGLKESEWVEASGTLDEIDYDINGDGKAKKVPFIELDSVKRVDKGSTSGVIFPF
jgi:uncharacterized repeat protein (TIGR03943 family)